MADPEFEQARAALRDLDRLMTVGREEEAVLQFMAIVSAGKPDPREDIARILDDVGHRAAAAIVRALVSSADLEAAPPPGAPAPQETRPAQAHCHGCLDTRDVPGGCQGVPTTILLSELRPAASPDAPATRELSPDECDPEIYRDGTAAAILPIDKETAQYLCRELNASTGWRWDWNFAAGRVVLRFLRPAPSASTAQERES